MRLNRMYEYEIVERDYSGGAIVARLMGTDTSSESPRTITRGSPYELFMAIHVDAPRDGSVRISTLELYDTSTKARAFRLDEAVKEPLQLDSDGGPVAYFSFKHLELAYVRYRLVLKFQIMVDGAVKQEQSSDFYFEKAYEEYHSNVFLDQIMGV